MNLFELFVKVGVDDQASGPLEKLAGKLGSGLQSAAKVGLAAVSAAAAGVAALTTAAVNNYAEYEQLVGGAELMFGEAYKTVEKNAKDAFKTVQMSQNDYLQQVNGFATGLKTALGGNEQAAADLAHKIIQAEADVVAATGNSQEAVQNAFNGIMKSNFTMLDNLQIGITPTKEGFQEVIDKVNEWNEANGQATEYQMGNLADMQSALVDYIEMVGMSEYAQNEAAGTITGSIASMKAAWENLITGLADANANLDPLIENLVASVETVIANVVPKIGVALNSTIKLVRDLIPVIVQEIPLLIEQNLPALAEAAVGLIEAFIDGINSSKGTLISTVLDVVLYLVEAFFNVLPQITQVGVETLVALAEGISTTIPKLIPVATEAIVKIVDTLTNPDSTQRIINASVETIKSLASGLVENIPKLVESAVEIITSLFEFLTDPGLLKEMFNAAVEVIKTLAQSLIQEIPQLLESAIEIILGLVNFLLEPSTLMALIDSALEIILTLVNSLVDNVDELLNAAIEIIMALVQFLLEPENLDKIISAAIDLVITLVTALVESAYLLIDAAVQLILSLVEYLTQPDRIQQLIEVGIKLVLAIIDGLVSMVADIGEAGADLVMKLWDAFTNVDWKGLGKGIVDGIWNGLKSAWNTLSSWVSDAWNSLFGDKDEISLSAPSSSYSTQDLLAMKTGQKSVTGYINPNAQPLGSTVNVTQNIYSSAKTPSELMTEAYYQQRMGLVN